ncbi:hypothetical protein HanPSC8_Chr10g0433611 [Helianthus annuus]|nr:hypothetical protein HanPSC8_Chr10g0433611 [Helianthus annuus]
MYKIRDPKLTKKEIIMAERQSGVVTNKVREIQEHSAKVQIYDEAQASFLLGFVNFFFCFYFIE